MSLDKPISAKAGAPSLSYSTDMSGQEPSTILDFKDATLKVEAKEVVANPNSTKAVLVPYEGYCLTELNERKNNFLSDLNQLCEAVTFQEYREQIQSLKDCFFCLFSLTVPDKIPDFRILRRCFGIMPNAYGSRFIGCLKYQTSFQPSIETLERNPTFRSTIQALPDFVSETQFYTPIDKTIAIVIKKWLRNKKLTRVLEVGAGGAWWAAAISHSGGGRKKLDPIVVTATDSKESVFNNVQEMFSKFQLGVKRTADMPKGSDGLKKATHTGKLEFTVPPQNQEKAGHDANRQEKYDLDVEVTVNSPHHVELIDAAEAICKYAKDNDILLITSPTEAIIPALKLWPREKPILWVSTSTISESVENVLGLKIRCQKVDNSIDSLVITLPLCPGTAVIEVVKITSWPISPAKQILQKI